MEAQAPYRNLFGEERPEPVAMIRAVPHAFNDWLEELFGLEPNLALLGADDPEMWRGYWLDGETAAHALADSRVYEDCEWFDGEEAEAEAVE